MAHDGLYRKSVYESVLRQKFDTPRGWALFEGKINPHDFRTNRFFPFGTVDVTSNDLLLFYTKIEKKLEYSPEWKGPLKNRSCTDWPCLVIFVLFMAVWIAVGSYALTHGDVKTFLAPKDSFGRKCGIDEEVINEPHLVFFDLRECLNLKNKCNTPQVCRKQCPSSNWFDLLMDWSSLEYTRERMICETGIDVWSKNVTELKSLIGKGKCAKWYLNSKSIVGRCFPVKIPTDLIDFIPMSEAQLAQAKKAVKALAFGEAVIDTIISTRSIVLGLIAGGAWVSLVYIIFLRWLAFPFVFLSTVVLLGCFGTASYFSYEQYAVDEEKFWLALTIVFGVIAALILLLVMVLLKRIRLACQLIKEASKAVSSILSSLLFPLGPWLLHLATISYVVVVGIHLWTMEFDETWQFRLSVAIHIVGFIWLYCFITALGEMILSATFATWYWTFRKSQVPFFALATGAWRTLRYHLGTVAFGSLLITICRLVRYILEGIKHAANKEGSLVQMACQRCCICCTQVFFGLLEGFLKFMNRNAYIVCAVYGKGLCSSAADALSLLVRNSLRVVVLNNIVSWLLFLGKISIAGAMGATTWWYYTHTEYEIAFWWVPVVLVVIGAYLVANVFFGVYEVAVDTLFLCFLEDCERHDGSVSKPYYMSYQLRKLLRKDI